MRIILFLVGMLGAVLFWPWVTLVCMILLAVRYYAWEVIFMGMFVDLQWMPTSAFLHLPVYTLLGLLLVWGFEPLRREFLY